MVSHRCGIGSEKCPFACSIKESDSRCTKYSDRKECSKSMQQRKKSARHSKATNKKRALSKKYI